MDLETRMVRWSQHAENFRIKRFAPQTLTPGMLRGYLDSLELTERFIPDLILLDYAGLMKTDSKNQRIDIGRNVVELRSIAVERNMAIVTVHQSSKAGATAESVRSVHVAEDWSVVHTADSILTLSATETEKSLGLARLYVEHARMQKDHWGLLLTQALPIGQFVRQSIALPDDYWEHLAEHEAESDEETGDVEEDEENFV
jgi:hypothetical protein